MRNRREYVVRSDAGDCLIEFSRPRAVYPACLYPRYVIVTSRARRHVCSERFQLRREQLSYPSVTHNQNGRSVDCHRQFVHRDGYSPLGCRNGVGDREILTLKIIERLNPVLLRELRDIPEPSARYEPYPVLRRHPYNILVSDKPV